MRQPNTFQQWLHGISAWRNWTQPAAEDVVVHRDRRIAPHATGPVDWGDMADQRINLARRDTVGFDGRGHGQPMQNGSDATRPITWGHREWGHRYIARIPRPAHGDYWTGGAPVPMFDRHCVIAAPDGSVHELIQLDPGTPTAWWWPTNVALGWGRWVDGKLVEGKAATATKLPIHATNLTTRSVEEWHSYHIGHALALVISDYVGADGLLGTGPIAGELLTLDPTSDSYERMVALGGVCEAVAEMAAEHGIRIIDRNGYADANAKNVGTKPGPPSLHVHAGSQWAGSNLHLVDIPLTDLRRTS